MLYCFRHFSWAGSFGKCSFPGTDRRSSHGTAAAPRWWKTPCSDRGPSPSHPLSAGNRASSRASRRGMRWPRNAASASSPEPMITSRSSMSGQQVRAHRRTACTAPASDSRTKPPTPGRTNTCPAACALGSMCASEKPRKCRSADSSGIDGLRDRRRAGIFAQEDLVPIDAEVGHDAQLAAGRNEFQSAPRWSSAYLPACPYPAFTVFHLPAASCICSAGIVRPPLLSCDAARKVLPSGQSTQPCSSSAARPDGGGIPKSSSRVCVLRHAQFGAREPSGYRRSVFSKQRQHVAALVVIARDWDRSGASRRTDGTPGTAAI